MNCNCLILFYLQFFNFHENFNFLLFVNFSGMEKLQELDKEIQEQEK